MRLALFALWLPLEGKLREAVMRCFLSFLLSTSSAPVCALGHLPLKGKAFSPGLSLQSF